MMAAIMNDEDSTVGRFVVGIVMGSKKLKLLTLADHVYIMELLGM